MTNIDLTTDIFRLFNNEWALLTAGTIKDYNAMTISWGQLGSLWGGPGKAKNIATVFVKPIRYTYLFLERHETFTLCWFPKEYKKDLTILGTASGRDGNKLSLTQLTPEDIGDAVGYKEATRTLVCKKIYSQALQKEGIPADVVNTFYTTEDPHVMYIGEVLRMC